MKKRYDAIFLSPHPDDAVLSAGGMIADLSKQNKRVLIFTIFTKILPAPDAEAARHYLASCGIDNEKRLTRVRLAEDKVACQILRCNFLHCGFTDAPFRRRGNKPLYPTLRSMFFSSIKSDDVNTQTDILHVVDKTISKLLKPDGVLYCPLGTGGHVDHLIVRASAVALKYKPLCLWDDVPYRWNQYWTEKARLSLPSPTISRTVNVKKQTVKKRRAVQSYQSQQKGLYESGLNDFDFVIEKFYDTT
jgi:LmbE family N-acetylglucosaminyl deacetylase